MKTIYKILIIIALLAIGGFALYYFFNKVTVPTPIENQINVLFPGFKDVPEKTSPPDASSTKEVVISQFSDVPVFDFWVNHNTNEVFYITNEGKIYSAKNGDDIDLNTQPLETLHMIVPNNKGNRILASFGDPQNPRWGVFDVVDGVWMPLPDKIFSISWGKDENTLLGISDDGTNRSLVSFDIAKNPTKITTLIKDFRLRDVSFVWNDPSSIFIIEKPAASIKGRVWSFDTKNNSFTTIEKGANGLAVLFSSSNDYALKFSIPNNIFITKRNFEPILPLFVSTLPIKCGFGASRLYCFLPQDNETFSKASLPDDYFQNKLYSIDTLVSIDPENGDSVTIAKTGTEIFDPYDGEHLEEAGNSLFFLNHYDKKVYEVRIPEGFFESTKPNNTQQTNEPLPF